MQGWVSRSARAGSRRPWRSGGRRKKDEKGRDGGALGVLIGQGVPGQGKWCLGAVDLALSDSTANGRRRQRRCAGRGVVEARGGVWDACAREEVPRGGLGGAGGFSRVHLVVGARWTKSTGGVRRAARNRASREERDGDRGFSVISENPGTSR